MITDVPGITIGHVTDTVHATGCTVVLCPPNARCSCEVRGNSPGSRELALLAPEKSMQEVHAILLTGGSAFGLASAEGIVQWMQEHDLGYKTPWAKVPIIPGAVVFDLNVGSSSVRPTAASGYEACRVASKDFSEGSVGAGTGATVGKWAGVETWMKGGIGSASMTAGELVVGTLAVVNAVGDIVGEKGEILAGARGKDGKFLAGTDAVRKFARGKVLEQANTTLVVMATNASLAKIDLFRICQRMHDGMARAVVPVHTSYDGDVTFGLSVGNVVTDLDFVAEISALLTAKAIRRAALAATEIAGVPAIGS